MIYEGDIDMINKELLIEANSFFENTDDQFKKEIEIELLLVDIASEFIKYRALHDISQKELAGRLEISQAMVSKLESGDYNPTVRFLFEISRKLDWDFSLNINSHIDAAGYHYSTSSDDKKLPMYNYCEEIGLAS